MKIKVEKTVVNTGNVIVDPSGFEFALDNVDAGMGEIVQTDETGNAYFVLNFSEEDIDKTKDMLTVAINKIFD